MKGLESRGRAIYELFGDVKKLRFYPKYHDIGSYEWAESCKLKKLWNALSYEWAEISNLKNPGISQSYEYNEDKNVIVFNTY